MAPMGGHLGGPKLGRADARRSNSGSAYAGESGSMTDCGEGGGGIYKARDVFPDLHHKMSKKIAQLTKVIYHLNTKNEDRQAREIRGERDTTTLTQKSQSTLDYLESSHLIYSSRVFKRSIIPL